MKAYLVGNFSLPDGTAAAQLIMGIANIMTKAQCDTVIIDKVTESVRRVQIRETDMNGRKVIQIAYPDTIWGQIDKVCGFRHIKERIGRGEILCCYNYPSFGMIPLLLHCKKNRIANIPIITEWYATEKATGFLSHIRRLVKGTDIFLRMCILNKKSDAMMVSGTFLRDYYVRNCPAMIIPNVICYDDPKWNQPFDEYEKDKINFVYAGSPGRDKDNIANVLRILDGASQGKRYVLRVIGVTKEQFVSYHPECMELASRQCHIFEGRKPHSYCIKAIKSSDYSILYRDSTRVTNAGFPTKFGESMACGTPQITTDTSDLRSYIEEGKNGHLIAFEVDEAIKQVSKIFQLSEEERRRQKEYTAGLRLFSDDSYVKDMGRFLESYGKK